MNKQPIETARDDDIRLSAVAMKRAAQRAWEIARQTDTAIVIKDGGVVREIKPSDGALDVQLEQLRRAC